MLNRELSNELIEFIIKKARPQLPSPILHAIKDEIFKQLNHILDLDVLNNLCLSVYYGTVFNTLSQLPMGPLNTMNSSTTEGTSESNWLVSKDFFLQLLTHHQTALFQKPEIQDLLSILDLKQADELAMLLFKSFNDYLVENFTASLTVQDLIDFIETELASFVAQQTEVTDSKALAEEPQLVSSPILSTPNRDTFETLQLTLTRFLEELAPQVLKVMAQDEMFQACEYAEDYFKSYLRNALPLKKWVEGFVEKDRHYLRNEAGQFVKNDQALIWDQMNDIYNGQQTGENAIRRLFELMNTSKAGFDHYHREFFNEFKELSQTQDLDPAFKARVQETLCQLAYLKMEHELTAFNSLTHSSQA